MSRSFRVVVIAVAAFATTTAVAYPATVANWSMNETSGTVMRDSAGNNDGAIHGVGLGVPGVNGTGYEFRGNGGSYVRVPSSASLNPGAANITIRLWVRFTERPNIDYDLLRKGLSSTAGGHYKVEIWSSGKALCEFRGSSGRKTLIGGPALDDNAWHQISCVKTATSVRLLVDGVSRASAAVRIGSISNSTAVFIATKPGDDFYKGSMDEARITVG